MWRRGQTRIQLIPNEPEIADFEISHQKMSANEVMKMSVQSWYLPIRDRLLSLGCDVSVGLNTLGPQLKCKYQSGASEYNRLTFEIVHGDRLLGNACGDYWRIPPEIDAVSVAETLVLNCHGDVLDFIEAEGLPLYYVDASELASKMDHHLSLRYLRRVYDAQVAAISDKGNAQSSHDDLIPYMDGNGTKDIAELLPHMPPSPPYARSVEFVIDGDKWVCKLRSVGGGGVYSVDETGELRFSLE